MIAKCMGYAGDGLTSMEVEHPSLSGMNCPLQIHTEMTVSTTWPCFVRGGAPGEEQWFMIHVVSGSLPEMSLGGGDVGGSQSIPAPFSQW